MVDPDDLQTLPVVPLQIRSGDHQVWGLRRSCFSHSDAASPAFCLLLWLLTQVFNNAAPAGLNTSASGRDPGSLGLAGLHPPSKTLPALRPLLQHLLENMWCAAPPSHPRSGLLGTKVTSPSLQPSLCQLHSPVSCRSARFPPTRPLSSLWPQGQGWRPHRKASSTQGKLLSTSSKPVVTTVRQKSRVKMLQKLKSNSGCRGASPAADVLKGQDIKPHTEHFHSARQYGKESRRACPELDIREGNGQQSSGCSGGSETGGLVQHRRYLKLQRDK